jgi:phospholipid transport system substrate-binding protein
LYSAGAPAEIVAPDVLAKNTTNEVLRIVKQDKDIKGGNNKKILDLVEAENSAEFRFSPDDPACRRQELEQSHAGATAKLGQ